MCMAPCQPTKDFYAQMKIPLHPSKNMNHNIKSLQT
jgi:hypothetical protein